MRLTLPAGEEPGNCEESDGCGWPATHAVFVPGGRKHMCRAHALDSQRTAEWLGMILVVMPIGEADEA